VASFIAPPDQQTWKHCLLELFFAQETIGNLLEMMPKPVGLHFFSFFSTQKSSLRPMPLGHYSPKNGGHLQMSLQALYQVTTIQLVHDNTHEAPRNEAGFSRCNSLDFPWENVRRKKPMEWKPYSWFFNPILICGKAYITVEKPILLWKITEENYCGKAQVSKVVESFPLKTSPVASSQEVAAWISGHLS
jgi:hypothetical protein